MKLAGGSWNFPRPVVPIQPPAKREEVNVPTTLPAAFAASKTTHPSPSDRNRPLSCTPAVTSPGAALTAEEADRLEQARRERYRLLSDCLYNHKARRLVKLVRDLLDEIEAFVGAKDNSLPLEDAEADQRAETIRDDCQGAYLFFQMWADLIEGETYPTPEEQEAMRQEVLDEAAGKGVADASAR
jgi:hypothetical protein